MKLVLSMVIALAFASSQAFSGPVIDKSKAMVISGVIAQGNILPLGKELLDRADRGESEVQLIINSPGGEVVTGFLFLNMMEAAKSKGLKVTCFVPTIAASMAYQIFLHCSERHTLNNAFLLWHRARINVGGMFGKPMTGPELAILGKDLISMDRMIFNKVVATMGGEVEPAVLLYHFNAETLHTGVNLHRMAPEFVTTHTFVEGLFTALLDRSVPRNEVLDRKSLSDADIIYITEKLK